MKAKGGSKTNVQPVELRGMRYGLGTARAKEQMESRNPKKRNKESNMVRE